MTETESYFHPIFSDFTSDMCGNITDVKKGEYKKKYLIIGTNYVCIREGILYKCNNFVWECYFGLLPEDETVVNIDGDEKNNQLYNLASKSINEIEIENEYVIKNQLQKMETYISMIHMHLDSKNNCQKQ